MTTPRRASDPEVALPSAEGHEVRVEDGRFTMAVCSCGWRGAGRRNRATARAEARDHALLYAGANALPDSPVDLAALERDRADHESADA